MAHGEITHVEFPADDPARAKAFYTAVAGWQFAAMDGVPDYFMAQASGGQSSAVGRRNMSTGPILRIYIEVDSIDDALEASSRTGGTTKEPKTAIPGMGWYAVVTDPEGSEVGLFQGGGQG